MNLERLFQTILKPTLGCTEPVAVALAVGGAVQASAGWTPDQPTRPIETIPPDDIAMIRVQVNKNIFKNTFSIYIPNADGHKGILMAAALGVFCDPALQLELFRSLTPSDIEGATRLIETGRLSVEIVDADFTTLFIEATVDLASGAQGACTIRDQHTNIIRLRQGDRDLEWERPVEVAAAEPEADLDELKALRLGDLVDLTADLPEAVRQLIRETIRMNRQASEAGLSQPMGLGAGFFEAGGAATADLCHYLSGVAAAGSDARMSGHPVEVMSSAGSGNQGIIATMPIVAFAERSGISEDLLVRAVALSHLVTMYITQYVGYLSALCGVAIKAGIGAACGITLARGGGEEQIGRAVKIMAATLSGMICDGAKPGCALKVGSSADMASRAAALAMQNMDVSDDNGIVAATAEETIRNLAELSRVMDTVDQKIIEIMNEKIKRA